MSVKAKCISLGLIFSSVFCHAQQVQRVVVAEHFTNTWCSICASKNPPFYANLAGFPQVLHVAYHPSAPYAGCPLSVHNVIEADARTNFYGIYGGTPRLVMQGNVLAASTPFADPTIFSSVLGTTTSFAMATEISRVGPDSLQAVIRIRKTDTSSLNNAQLYAIATEDTVIFTGGNANGEPRNYDVFRKSFVGNDPVAVTLPAVVGDSVVITKRIAVSSVWLLSHMSATAILQDANKVAIQAARSPKLSMTAGINNVDNTVAVELYPNPATTRLFIKNVPVHTPYLVIDLNGSVVARGQLSSSHIAVNELPAGVYILSFGGIDGQYKPTTFVKE